MATEVHEGKEAEKTVIVGVEITVVEGNMACVPQRVDKLAFLVVTAECGSGSDCGYQSDAVAQFLESTGLQNLIVGRQ